MVRRTHRRSIFSRVRWDRVGLLLLVLMLCMSFGVNALADSAHLDCESIVVGSGDTLWGLIREVNPDFNGNMNDAIYKTCQLNDMKSSKICVGQNLLIPNL